MTIILFSLKYHRECHFRNELAMQPPNCYSFPLVHYNCGQLRISDNKLYFQGIIPMELFRDEGVLLLLLLFRSN